MKIGSFKILGLKMQLKQEKSLGISQLMKFEIDCQACCCDKLLEHLVKVLSDYVS